MTSFKTADPRPPRRRRLVFAALAVALVVLVIEGASWLVLSVLAGRPTGWGGVAARRAAVARSDDPVLVGAGEAGPAGEMPLWAVAVRERFLVHPYLGFVTRPPDDLASLGPRYRPEAADLGFPYNFHELVNEPSPERVIVAVVGGSVSQQVAGHGRPYPLLETALEELPRFRGRDVQVLSLAAGGYKQPQQLMVLTYLLSLGAHFDVVVNLDGFNEITLPIRENLADGVNPFYPRAWRYRLGEGSRDELEARGAAVVIDDLRRRWARAASRRPWRSSLTASLVWWLVDSRLQAEAAKRQLALLEDDDAELDAELAGPSFEASSDAEVLDALAAHWRRCSGEIDRLARGHGIEYYHFLQPNQYDQGAKPLSAEERRRAFDPGSEFVELVAEGYPRLRDAGEELAVSGVAFVDLSGVFAEVEDTVYIDTCCHLNPRGIGMVVDRMVEAVASGPRVAPGAGG